MARRHGVNPQGEWVDPFSKKDNKAESDGDSNNDLGEFSYTTTMEVLSGVGLTTAENQQRVKVGYENIRSIQPDPAQPRRIIPHSVRGDERVSAETLPSFFVLWKRAAENERGAEIDIDRHLRADESERSYAIAEAIAADDEPANPEQEPVECGPLEGAFMQLVELAASIREKGLLNPITLIPDGIGFVIETGERRWMAYHMLMWHFGAEEEIEGRGKFRWDKIPAVVVDAPDVWRQAIENNARDDLNAISKARQLALLLMHIYSEEQRAQFEPINAFEHERDFYAQVADGFQYRIPGGKAEQLAHALRFSSTKQLRDYRRLLKIPYDLWDKADDENLPEGAIREMAKDWGSVPNGTLHAERTNGAGTVPQNRSVPNGTLPAEKALKSIYGTRKKIMNKLNDMSFDEREEIIYQLNAVLKDLKRAHKEMPNSN